MIIHILQENARVPERLLQRSKYFCTSARSFSDSGSQRLMEWRSSCLARSSSSRSRFSNRLFSQAELEKHLKHIYPVYSCDYFPYWKQRNDYCLSDLKNTLYWRDIFLTIKWYSFSKKRFSNWKNKNWCTKQIQFWFGWMIRLLEGPARVFLR